MESQDLSKILIKDTPYYNRYYDYANILKRKNITTVGQILDASFLELTKHCQSKTLAELKGLIAMLRYKYSNEPLCYDILLDEEIDIKRISCYCYPYPSLPIKFEKQSNNNFNENNGYSDTSISEINLMEFFGCPKKVVGSYIYHFLEDFKDEETRKKENLPDNPKVIDFIKYLREKIIWRRYGVYGEALYLSLHSFLDTYVEAYENNKKTNYNESNMETIALLRKQLDDLMKTKENLDSQINELEQKIKILSDEQLKGSIKK